MGKTYVQGETLTALDLNASLSEAVNVTGYFVFTGAHVHNANLVANSGIWNASQNVYGSAVTLNSRIFGTTLQFVNGPYTVNVPSPAIYKGAQFTVWINTPQTITMVTPAGNFVGTGGKNTNTLLLKSNYSVYNTFTSDGSNWNVISYAIVDNDGNLTVGGSLYTSGTITSGQGNIPRVSVATTSTTLDWNSDLYDEYVITAQSGALSIPSDAGNPVHGRKIIFRIKDNGTASAITWNKSGSKSFREVGAFLPTSTTSSMVAYIGAIYNSTESLWDVVAVSIQS